jgi:uncharacterized membrane protein
MKTFLRSPFGGLVLTGAIATIALLVEPRLQVAPDVHFLLQFLWLGIVAAALLAFAIQPAVNALPQTHHKAADHETDATVAEFFDADRQWPQTPSDITENEQF